MPDNLGWRMKFAVLTPSANTVVQPEYEAMRPPGVTNHVFRMTTDNPPRWKSDNDLINLIRQIDANIDSAVTQAMTSNPDHLILGVSSESIWDGGIAACEKLTRRIEDLAGNGIKLTQPAEALPAALQAHNVRKSVAVLTPYFPVAEQHIADYMQEIGFPVKRFQHLESPRPTGIAEIKEERILAALRELDDDDIGAIVQFGANLPMMKIAAEAERWLKKPVLAINTATYWHALRKNGIKDKIYGCGRLLAEF